MMNAAKLEIIYDFDFDLIGLVCTERDYKLAWLLNQLLNINFVKRAPVKMAFSSGLEFQLVLFDYETENDSYQLLRNKAVMSNDPTRAYLLPELKEYDFFLRIDNITGTIDIETTQESISLLSQVQYSSRIEVEELKNRENLLF